VGHVDGYVDFLPVPTDPARALGVDIWGYPKTVADVTHRDRGATRHTTVTVDGHVGAWPASRAFSMTLGDHPRADRLRRLDAGDRALLRFAAAEVTIHAGRSVGDE
jgi:hypothetical protein